MKPALIAGVVGGLLPDIDIVIRSAEDPLLAVEYHRHFTHSLAFIPIGGLVAALLCLPVLRKKIGFAPLYAFATLGYATHGLLDAMTNYGTHLLWPFSERRESWNAISIIDPIFTLTLLGLCIAAARKTSRNYVLAAAAFGCLYLSFGVFQREAATQQMYALAKSRGHEVERSEVKPSFANNIVWRTQYRFHGNYYIDAVRLFPGSEAKIYEGGSVQAFDLSEWAQKNGTQSQQYKDLTRFEFFSDGWLAKLPENESVIADMRFANLPNSTVPLWGVVLRQPEQHVEFGHFPRNRTGQFPLLWAMVIGDDLPQEVLALMQ